MKLRPAGGALLWLLILSVAAASIAAELPDGKGKDVVESTCTECHSISRIKAQHLTEEEWNGIIREMIEKGATVNSNDLKVIVSYLVKNFGPDKKK